MADESMLLGHNRQAADSGSESRAEARKSFKRAIGYTIGLAAACYVVTLILLSDDIDGYDVLSPSILIWWGAMVAVFGAMVLKFLPENDTWKKWRKLPLALGATILFFGLATSGLQNWFVRNWDNGVEKCLGDQVCPEQQEPETAVQVTRPVPETHRWITTPANGCTNWITVFDHQNIRGRGTDPTGNRFVTEYLGEDGIVRLYQNTPGELARSVRFCSLTGEEEDIFYTITNKSASR